MYARREVGTKYPARYIYRVEATNREASTEKRFHK